jgi:hypothetical protein
MKIISYISLLLCITLVACRTVKKSSTSSKYNQATAVKIDSARTLNTTLSGKAATNITTESTTTGKKTTVIETIYVYDTVRGQSYRDRSTTTVTEETKAEVLKREKTIDSLVSSIAHTVSHSYKDTAVISKQLDVKNKEAKAPSLTSRILQTVVVIAILVVLVYLFYRYVVRRFIKL